MFVKTGTILDQILVQKQQELQAAQAQPSLTSQIEKAARRCSPARDFKAALQRSTVALIAEIKKASPSKGLLVKDFDPVRIARTYEESGAAAISVLTDHKFFQGSLEHLQVVRATVQIPILRKDFIINAHQVYEARAAGADATLLIVMALEDAQLRDLHRLIIELGMAALVEVHNEAELERALAIGATLIGVNNRDLRTFHEDLQTTARVAALIPPSITLVAESAIRSAADVRQMGSYGARAVLVGEGLVKAKDIASEVRLYSSQPSTPAV
jgi:indole-3-glycerol phosphate synthase